MVVVKGTHVKFEMADAATPGAAAKMRENPMRLTTGKIISLPRAYGMFHDQDGESVARCRVIFGPFVRTQRRAKMTRAADRYFGGAYPARLARIDLPPEDGWRRVGDVIQIFYRRPGAHEGTYYHPFKSGYAPLLEKRGRFYRLTLPDGCVYDDRGYVFP